MSNKPGTSGQVISLPQGGGALQGIGEKFTPDLFTGTGNFTIPIALPPGRSGFQPQLNLVYSTGSGNGPFGLGWSLSVPGVSRKTSSGVPRYRDGATVPENRDTFILSGAEDLVPIEETPAVTRYRPRTEGLFAQIDHHHAGADYWEVRSKDGLVSAYGHDPADTPNYASVWVPPVSSACIAKPGDPSRIFAWKLTATKDPFDNRIEYIYRPSKTGPLDESNGHHSEQPLLRQIRYADFTDDDGRLGFLITVTFDYEDRPDRFSEYRAGFETRTVERCKAIRVETHFDAVRIVRKYGFNYDNSAPNGVSLLQQIEVIGYDDEGHAYDGSDPQFARQLPPLTFDYTRFDPKKRTLEPVAGAQLPAQSLANPSLELADLSGDGLPDILEMNGTVRYWRNLGNGRFDPPRSMHSVPAGLALANPGVQLLDADGDGRIDLLTTINGLAGYFPLQYSGNWDLRSFHRYPQIPSFNLEDPEVKLVDLDGDGLTDIIRSGTRLECYFNRPDTGGWSETRRVERRALAEFPDVNFSDPRVKWGDMSGDGLQDIVLVNDGNIEYWPSLGHGDWGKRVRMQGSPRFRDLGYSFGYDPRRLLLGDVDGDGLDDIVYVGDRKVTLWLNQSGNGWSEPIPIDCAPPVSDMDAVRLVDLLGSGISGVLWSADASGPARKPMHFLDFTGGVKPYLLDKMDNHLGAVTKVGYKPSTHFFLEDQKRVKTRWQTSLPFPVQVVACVEVIDELSKGKLTTEYRYHHGYWDGAEREFRGFGMVEQLDTESFEAYNQLGLHDDLVFVPVPQTVGGQKRFSPPLLTKTWFHQGPIGPEFGDWKADHDWSADYWAGDPALLDRNEYIEPFLKSLAGNDPRSRRIRRDALRTLRGSTLRTELYARDGSARETRPYTVTESQYALHELELPAAGQKRLRIFFPHLRAQRTTQWERGDDPMTQFSFTRYTDESNPPKFDPFGRPLAQTQIACPRGWRTIEDQPAEPYLATRTCSIYATPISPLVYIHNRVAKVTSYEILHTSGQRITDIAPITDASVDLQVIGQTLSFYDGDAFVGLPLGHIGNFGAVTRSESLVLTDEVLQDAYGTEVPPYLEATGNPLWTPDDYPIEFRTLLPRRAGYTFHAGSADPTDLRGYFVNTDRRRYDFQTRPKARGLVLETLDPLHDRIANPLGHRTRIAYDTYQFLPVEVTDAAGLTTKAVYDYRVLQPKAVTDPNGNTSSFTFSPLGLLESTFIRGKTATVGDRNRPSVRLKTDFLAFANSPPGNRQPIFVRAIRHTHHDTELDVLQPELDETITTVEYSDGFGRLLQTRTQGEEERFGDEHFGGGEAVLPAKQSDGAGGDVVGRRNLDELKPNVVVSGWQIYDNKGQVVEKYEPFFAEGWDYGQPDDSKTGEKAAMFYDPRGQVIRTLNPDSSEQRVIYGVPGTITAPDLAHPAIFEPTPWEAYTYDANDNAGRTHPAESAGYRHHWNTPASILIDALGRTIKAVERNREPLAAPQSPVQALVTQTSYDIRGNVLTITDALGRQAFRDHVYDYANRMLRMDSIDAGLRKTVLDAAGNVMEGRDSKDALVLRGYDALNRPLRLWARDGTGQRLTLRERLEYGDAGSPNQPAADRAANKATNRLGRLLRYFDEAGLLSFEAYDFKGNLLEKTRRVVSDAAILGVFAGPPAAWNVSAFRVDWTTPTAVPLDAGGYTSTISYDALNRVKLMTYPEDVENGRRQLKPQYNRAGALEGVALERVAPGGAAVSDTFVERIAYNAKGQRVLIAYGNGIMTRYAYDPHTFRLLHLRTERYTKPAELTYRHTGAPHQELAYVYDLVGNITDIHDRTPGSGIRDAASGLDALDRKFIYDALYRLRSATGRECDLPPAVPWDDTPRSTDLTRTRGYTEDYQYDLAGNIEELKHAVNGGGFKREFDLVPGNNRLRTLTVGATIFGYDHDASGNMTRETTSRHFEWDYADRMRVYRTQTGASEPSVHAHYLYDAGGQRVKKLVRKQGGQVEVTVYIDGAFEYQRIVRGGAIEQNNTLHVMDDQSRIALVRVGQPFANDSTPAVKYHLGDHLGSSNVVIDSVGKLVNCEEYTPYGETSFGNFARKRYRFTGRERDEESRLNYHGARYLAPWLGRWISCDPTGVDAGINLYRYANSNPASFTDLQGLTPESVGGDLPNGNRVSGTPAHTDTATGQDFVTESVLLPASASNIAPQPRNQTLNDPSKQEQKMQPGQHERNKTEESRLEKLINNERIPESKLLAQDPTSLDHIASVVDVINFALGRTEGPLYKDLNLQQKLEEARGFVTSWRSNKHSESLILRDAERYLWARSGVGQHAREQGFLFGSVSAARTLSKPAAAFYDGLKFISIATGLGFGRANEEPFSARGGDPWFKLGLEHWDKLDQNKLDTVDSVQHLTYDQVIRFQREAAIHYANMKMAFGRIRPIR